jgi:hypothetical protein
MVVSAASAAVHEQMGSIVVVSWDQSAEGSVWVEYSVDEGVWLSSPVTQRPAGTAEELLLGVPFATAVEFRLAWDGGTSEAASLVTADLPDGAPRPALVEGDPALWDAGSPWVLLCISGASDSVLGTWSVIVDRQGRVVWAQPSEQGRTSLHTQLSADGSQILIDQNSFWSIFDYGAAATVDRFDIEGTLIESIPTPGAHHPFTELPDGSLAWGAINEYFVDETLTVRSPDGTTRELWNCSAFLDAEGGAPDDYCGTNTLSYSAERDTFLYSFFSLETMIEVDAQTGETVRYFGHTGDGAWAFESDEAAFWWQHGGHYTAQGTLLVSSKNRNNGNETVLIEYALDEDSETLVEVFRFGDGEGLYGDTMGEADYTVSGNILHNYGSRIRIREVTPDGQVAWDIGWRADMLGRSTPVPDLYALKSD